MRNINNMKGGTIMKRANNIVVKSMERGNYMKKNVICGGINTASRTPIEIALSAEDGFTTAKKLYEWLELDPTHIDGE